MLSVTGLLFVACDNTPAEPTSCQRIIDACHDVDPGTGMAHECHETAHDDGTAAACDPIADECVAACEALAGGDAGTHEDGGGDHDAGH